MWHLNDDLDEGMNELDYINRSILRDVFILLMGIGFAFFAIVLTIIS